MEKKAQKKTRLRSRGWPHMILGWREWIALPELGIGAMKAKLDSGARSSSLHVRKLQTFQKDGVDMVRFLADYDPKDPTRLATVEVRVSDERIVKDSGGHGELRVVIRTQLEIAERRWPIDLTLTSRAGMRFRMLIGREALSRHVLVDSGRSYLAGSGSPALARVALDEVEKKSP